LSPDALLSGGELTTIIDPTDLLRDPGSVPGSRHFPAAVAAVWIGPADACRPALVPSKMIVGTCVGTLRSLTCPIHSTRVA
jgi:hypothetical protein